MSHKQLLLANKNESVRAESRYRREKQAAKRGRSISPRPPIANGRLFEMKHFHQVCYLFLFRFLINFKLQLRKATMIAPNHSLFRIDFLSTLISIRFNREVFLYHVFNQKMKQHRFTVSTYKITSEFELK